MPTPDIFDFDTDNLARFEESRMNAALISEPTTYLNHLRIAKWIDGVVTDREADDDPEYARALREIAAHLRQGDLLDSGILLR